jgi:hypothetical protein
LGLVTMIGDQDDLHVWRSKRNAWVECAAGCIETRDAAAARAFREAARVKRPRAGWQLAIPGEIDALRAAVQFVRRLKRARSMPGRADAGAGSAAHRGERAAVS